MRFDCPLLCPHTHLATFLLPPSLHVSKCSQNPRILFCDLEHQNSSFVWVERILHSNNWIALGHISSSSCSLFLLHPLYQILRIHFLKIYCKREHMHHLSELKEEQPERNLDLFPFFCSTHCLSYSISVIVLHVNA